METTTQTDTLRVRIVDDTDCYLFYLGVVAERLNPQCKTCNRGPSWEVLDSVWGIDVITDDAALPYLWEHAGDFPPFVLSADLAREIPGYLGEIVREMLPCPHPNKPDKMKGNPTMETQSMSIAGTRVDASYLKPIVEEGRRQHGDRFDPSDLESAAHFAPYFHGIRIKVTWTGAGGEDYTRTGTVGKTTGWRPAFLLMHRSSDRGSSDVLGANDRIVAIWDGRKYVPVGGTAS